MNTKRKTSLILATAMVASLAAAETAVEEFNKLGYGTLSGRLQSVSMYRDYDNGVNAHATSLGIILNYASPEMAGFTIGGAYNGAGVLNSMDYGDSTNPGEFLVQNGRVSLLNEGYIAYNFEALGAEKTSATIGRRVNNAEIFRADDIRQKSRSITAIQAESKGVENWRFAGGHAFDSSNILDAENHPVVSSWKFENFGEVFNKGYNTDGVTWGETAYTGIKNLDIAVFDAVAWDVANMFGVRAAFKVTDKTSILGYYRNEFDVGRAANHGSDAFGLSAVQKIGKVRVEGGYFGVYGDALEFNQFSTGFNHALGTSLMVYNGQYAGGADSLYLKATTKLEDTKTILYTLAHYTIQNKLAAFDTAGELDVIVKQPIGANLTVAGKVGAGYRDGPNTFATDARLFLTYAF